MSAGLVEALRAPPPGLAETRARPPAPGRIEGGGGRPAAPLVSVVTVARNAASTLPRTIESLRAQTLRREGAEIEHIVVDGGSRDGTPALLEAAGDVVSFWLSEPDEGISDAFNKGIALARAPLVALLNADDRFDPGHLERAAAALSAAPAAGFSHADMVLRAPGGPVLARLAAPRDYAVLAPRRMPVNHPTMVARLSLYEAHGLFRPRLRYTMDHDLLWRLAEAGVPAVRAEGVGAEMAPGGVSDERWLALLRESWFLRRAHGAGAAGAAAVLGGALARGLAARALLSFGGRGLYRALRERRRARA